MLNVVMHTKMMKKKKNYYYNDTDGTAGAEKAGDITRAPGQPMLMRPCEAQGLACTQTQKHIIKKANTNMGHHMLICLRMRIRMRMRMRIRIAHLHSYSFRILARIRMPMRARTRIRIRKRIRASQHL